MTQLDYYDAELFAWLVLSVCVLVIGLVYAWLKGRP